MDGGGTSTAAWLADERGRVVARAAAGPSNPFKVEAEAARREILRAARKALDQAGLKSSRVQAVCLGLAGVDRPPVRRKMLAWLRRSIPAHSHLLTTDAAIALFAALGRSPGIVVISGTGSIAYGQDERGRILRAGGWGAPFDDAGSGFDLGHRAVSAALRAADGRAPRTPLTRKLCRALGLRNITEVVLRRLEPPQVAALFPHVHEAAEKGDRVARALCEQAGVELAGLALALIRRFRWRRHSVRVVAAGGVFKASALVRRSFARHLREQAPRARVSLLRRAPVEGALALARQVRPVGAGLAVRLRSRPRAKVEGARPRRDL